MTGERAIHERAPAKVNLVLHVGERRRDGLHTICSLFASIDLSDELVVAESPGGSDRVVCAVVEGENVCDRALAAFRTATGAALPPLEVRIDKRIPVAAGLGGGSADAAATLRAANEIAGRPLDAQELRHVAAGVGADVPSQVAPRHALVTGAGEQVEPIELPAMTLLLLPASEGLSTREVYAEADRIGATRARLDPAGIRGLAGRPVPEIAAAVHSDLQAAAIALRPELSDSIGALRDTGALATAVTGSGPTVFGVFDRLADARTAAASLEGAIVTAVRP